MAPESQEKQNPNQQRQHESRQDNAANADATQREAYDYWGYLFKQDKCGMPLLDRLLKGIADVIVSSARCNSSATWQSAATWS